MNKIELYEVSQAQFQISTNQTRLNVEVIHRYLERSYWSPGVPRHLVQRAIEHSLCFGVYDTSAAEDEQVGFARLVTDYASFGYLADVFILSSHQGHGLGTWLIETIVEQSAIADIRSCVLATWDAHGLYAKFGFEVPAIPQKLMIKRNEMSWYTPQLAETHND